MKRKHTVNLLLAAMILTIFWSCSDGLTIFQEIEQETELEEPVITGAVTSVVRFNGKLYASDGNIYAKDETVLRGWGKTSKPDGLIIKLAADSSNLYALNEDKVLYTSTNADSWTKVDTTSMGTIQTIFWDGASAPAAYVKATSGSFYKLAGSTTPTTASDIISDVLLKTDKGTYTAKDSTVTGSNDLGSVPDLGTVYSLTYSAVDTALYAGTSKGLKRLPLDEAGKLSDKSQDPPGNKGATIKDYGAFAVLATGTNTGDAALYASTISSGSDYSKINGLWGYYYSRRDTWNRE